MKDHKNDNEEIICPICLSFRHDHDYNSNNVSSRHESKDTDWVTNPACGHACHTKCLFQWCESSMHRFCANVSLSLAHETTTEILLNKCTCPVCRKLLPPSVLDAMGLNNETFISGMRTPPLHTSIQIDVNSATTQASDRHQLDRKTYHALLYVLIALPACVAVPLTLGFLIQDS